MKKAKSQKAGVSAPSIPGETRVYAIGDVHGRADLLAKLLNNIAADCSSKAVKNAGFTKNVLVMLGDLVDRGPASKEVLEIFCGTLPEKIEKNFEIIILRGNHEVMMMDFIRGSEDAYDWLGNGGMETLESYGIDPHYRDFDELRAEFKEKLPKSHLGLLRKMKLRHRIGDYLFVHAGIRPGIKLAEQNTEDLLWIRHSFLDSVDDFGFVVVHGHSIRPKPEIRNNRIGIDTGAWISGQLCALVLENQNQRFIFT